MKSSMGIARQVSRKQTSVAIYYESTWSIITGSGAQVLLKLGVCAVSDLLQLRARVGLINWGAVDLKLSHFFVGLSLQATSRPTFVTIQTSTPPNKCIVCVLLKNSILT